MSRLLVHTAISVVNDIFPMFQSVGCWGAEKGVRALLVHWNRLWPNWPHRKQGRWRSSLGQSRAMCPCPPHLKHRIAAASKSSSKYLFSQLTPAQPYQPQTSQH